MKVPDGNYDLSDAPDKSPFDLSDAPDKPKALGPSVLAAQQYKPDDWAQTIQRGKALGVAPDLVARNPAEIERLELERNVETVRRANPKLGEWLASDDNLILARDDIDALSNVSMSLRVRDTVASPMRGIYGGIGRGISGLGNLLDAGAYGASRLAGNEQSADAYMRESAESVVNPSSWLRAAGDFIEGGALWGIGARAMGAEDPFATLPEERENIVTDVGEGFGNLVGQALATMANPATGVALMAGQGADQQAERAEKAGASEGEKASAVVVGAAITGITEKIGLDKLLDRLPPNVKNKAAQWVADKIAGAGIEGAQEAIEQVAHNATAQLIYDPESPLIEGVGDSATVGAAVGALARTVFGIKGRYSESDEAKGQQTALDGTVNAVAAAKLLTREPERLQSFIQQMAQTGADTVYLPGDVAKTMFQSMTPAQAAEDLGVPIESYMEGVLTGADVAIPIEVYGVHVAPKYHEQMREHIRFTPGAMTPAEAAEVEDRAAEAADRFMASVQSEMPSDQRVYDDVYGMLLGTGRYRRQDAEKQAQLLQAAFRSWGVSENLDPFALYSRYRLRIKLELPAALQSLDVDTVIDPLIERLRTGDVPRGTQRQSLADFIAAGGGVDDAALKGEIATLAESDRVVRRGKAPLVRKGADRDLDRVREAAAEAGFLPMDSDINDLLALLENEMAGQPTYAMGDEADSVDDRTIAALDSLDEELSRQGIDVTTTSNADIKRALFGESGREVPDALIQVFDQTLDKKDSTGARSAHEAARPVPKTLEGLAAIGGRAPAPGWVRATRVVGSDGTPAVVHRGSRDGATQPGDFGQLGAASGNPSAALGVFFTNAPNDAARYGQVGDYYLDLRNPKEYTADDAPDLDDAAEWSALREELIAAGHDGVVLDFSGVGGPVQMVVFEPGQVVPRGEPVESDESTDDDGFDEIEFFQSANDQTQTPEFKAWFGDSKVADADGRPLVVYHGTAIPKDQFRRDGGGSGMGAYFTDNREAAQDYAEMDASIDGDDPILMSVYLSIQNPYRTDDHMDFQSISAERRDALEAAGHDGVVGTYPDGSTEYIAFRPEQIKSATANRGTFDPNDPSILNQADGSPAENAIRRGYIKFGTDRHFTVGLLEKADATTFLHETGHFFLEVMGDLAADPMASDAIRSDYATLLDWFGVSSREQITVDHHEQFARGFEQYLGEGKAPNPELASAFARFKAWVKAIYRTLSALNVPLTDDVRGVMDRLLATDEEITQAETSMDYAGLFADARSAGWSDAEFATRLQLQERAREEAESRLMARAMKDVTRETKAWWKERSAEVREQVTAEVHALPVYRAWALLANGTQPDGTPIEGAGQKLDKAWLVQQYGQEWLNKHLLRKRVYSVTGGADPDVIALGAGFGSGDEMVRALANMQPMEAVIRAQTHQRMIDQYGDVLTDGTMPEQAMRAVHGGRRFQALEADLKALERLAGAPRPSAAEVRRTAELIIGQKKVRDLQPNTYLRAERKAAKDATKAAGQQKWGEALEAQRRRLLNARLYDVASKAQTETEKLQRYIKRFEKPALRARLGKIGRLDQVEALLAQYDLRTLSNKKLDQAKARGELLGLIQSGELIAPAGFVASLQGGQRTNWRDLSVEDLRGLRDILRQTEVAARAEYEALVNGERVKLDDIAEQVGSSTIDGGKPVMPIYGDLSPDESAKKWGKQMLASWLRPSALARLLDGGKDDGAWTRHVIQPVRRAVSEVLEPMKRKAHEDLSALYRKHYTVKEMAAMNERSVVPGLGLALSRWDVISLALNQGNAENRKAVLDSEVAGRKPYTEAGVQAAMATLDARDWAFVQDAWDLVDSFWPAIREAQVRRKGIAPPKVEAVPFTVTTRDGQTIDLKGGYYPLKYNGRLDAKARQHEMDEAFERMRAGTLSATQTKYGHTQERVGSGRQPVMLSMTVLHSHINNVVMDLALGDVVNYTDRLLARPQVRQALIETGNLDALDTWKLWLKDTATGEIGARSGADQLAQFIRFGFTKSKVGFNAMTIILQVTGLAQTIPVVGAGHTAAAALDFAGRPRQAIKQVMAESAFMRTRYELNAFNKDIAAVQEALKAGAPVGKGSGFLAGFLAAVRAVQMPPRLVSWAFLGIRQMQILVDSTTWLAGYRRAAGEGKSHDEAVRYADGIVENAQTSGMFSDRSAIERGTLSETTRQSEFVKLWTTLMSYMIAKGNIAFESYRRTDFKDPRAVLSFGSDMLLLFAAEALLMGLVKGGLPYDEDDESWWAWTGKTIGQQAISTIPFVREVPGMKYGGGNTPIGSTAGDLYKAFNQTQQGEVDEALVKSYINLIGTATGLPSAQINRAVDAYWREDAKPYEYVTGQRK